MNNLKITTFSLEHSTEVNSIVDEILQVELKNTLVHISSYMLNTVLVQTLKSTLQEKLPNSKISCVHSEDRSKTVVTLYGVDALEDGQDISDIVLAQLHNNYDEQALSLKKSKNNLLESYFRDDLTHLPNIYRLRKDLLENAEAGLIILNIDNFKTINNFYGFNIGDFVIEQVSELLKVKLEGYKIYRLSINEFALCLENSLGFYELKELLTTLYTKLENTSINYQQSKIFINFTLASCSNSTNSEIFSKVAMALKYAKENNLTFWIYEDRMHFENEYANNLEMSNMVRSAVESSNIIPYFQPILDNNSGKIAKYESLARLLDESGNIISPVLFIPIAKQIKVYNLVTKIIIDKSFEAFKDNEYEFNINLSIEDIMSSEIFAFIIEKLKTCKASSRVTFELLESEAIEDFKKVNRFINEVKRYGAKIAIDDFGSGYSNFSYLTKMSVDFIKIDGSLIKDIDTDKSAALVVETIVDFAKKLNIKTVAEFVHSSTVMDKIKELGIDYSQGFYIDKPLLTID
ncbi:MAG: EAL domain-containing protein [Helicobacteraceae bacterium]|nr:EAL domain-containing protein [Helicobacteraceae bacterium]